MLFVISFFGIAIGSFINALVWRVHERAEKKGDKRLSIVTGHSMCPDCKHELAPIDLIPVVSWILLKGKCRYCRNPISVQYPAVELLTGGLFLLSYLRLYPVTGNGWLSFIVWLYFLTSLLALAVYDLRWMLLPDVILLPIIIVAAVWMVVLVLHGAPRQVLIGPLVAALAAGGSFYFLAAVSKGRWMGGGDIKLVFAMGLILGVRDTGVALFLAFVSASVVGIALLALRLRKRSEQIPFGPFLVAGTLAAMLYGPALINFYLRLSGLNGLV